jgi:hypothetical protein
MRISNILYSLVLANIAVVSGIPTLGSLSSIISFLSFIQGYINIGQRDAGLGERSLDAFIAEKSDVAEPHRDHSDKRSSHAIIADEAGLGERSLDAFIAEKSDIVEPHRDHSNKRSLHAFIANEAEPHRDIEA